MSLFKCVFVTLTIIILIFFFFTFNLFLIFQIIELTCSMVVTTAGFFCHIAVPSTNSLIPISLLRYFLSYINKRTINLAI